MFASGKGKQQKWIRVQCQEQCISHIPYITFRDCRVHIFSDNLSRNSCISGEKPGLITVHVIT